MTSLVRTAKFCVFEGTNAARTSKTPPPLFCALGGGKCLTVFDVVNVSVLGHAVSLDEVALEKLHSEVSAANSRGTLVLIDGASIPMVKSSTRIVVAEPLCRAGVFARIGSLMQARSGVRTEVIELLVEMLNAGVSPQFTSEESAGYELAVVVAGGSRASTAGLPRCYTRGGAVVDLETAFSEAGLQVQFFVCLFVCLFV